MSTRIRFVLDTNVVIDWLVFDDPYMTPLRARARDGAIDVLTHELAIAELERVLGYPLLKLEEAGRADVLARYRTQSRSVAMPPGFAIDAWQLPAGFPSCRDRDDDLFLALAYHCRATALVTRDKALLKMRKRVRKFGMVILTVQQMIESLQAKSAAGVETSAAK